MVDFFEHVVIKVEQKFNKKEFLENKIGLPDSKVIEEMKKLRLKKPPTEKVI